MVMLWCCSPGPALLKLGLCERRALGPRLTGRSCALDSQEEGFRHQGMGSLAAQRRAHGLLGGSGKAAVPALMGVRRRLAASVQGGAWTRAAHGRDGAAGKTLLEGSA